MNEYSIQVGKEFTSGHIGGVTCLLHLQDMEMIVSAGNDKRMCVWDSVDGKQTKSINTESIIFTMIRYPEFKDSKDTLLTIHQRGKDEGFCQIWDLPTFKIIHKLDFGNRGPFNCDDDTTGPIHLFMKYFESYMRDKQFQKISKPFLKFHNNMLHPYEEDYRLKLNKNERYPAGDSEKFMCVLFLKTQFENISTSTYGNDDENGAKGAFVASSQTEADDGTVRLMYFFDNEIGGGILGEKNASEGRLICMCSYLKNGGGKTQVIRNGDFGNPAYDIDQSPEITHPLSVKEVLVTSCVDKKRLIFWDVEYLTLLNGSDDGEVYKIDDDVRLPLSTMFKSLKEATIVCDHVQTSLLDWDDKKLLSGDSAGNITLWNIKKKEIMMRLPQIHQSAVSCLLWLSKNRFISGSYDGSIKMFDIIDSGTLALRDEKEHRLYLFDRLEEEEEGKNEIIARKFKIKMVNLSFSTCLVLMCL